MFDLSNKVAIVTGARRGIGRGIALALAKAGADVVVSDLNLEDCQKVVEEIEALGRKGLAVKCDVTQKSEVDQLVQKTVDELGKLDILVNNAGIVEFKPFLELTEDDWDKVLEVNLKGYFLCAQAAAKEMVKNNGGRIVNIASIASGQVGIGYPQIAHYCASKGGITALTEALALELSPQGINVNAIGPGVIETEMTKGMLGDEQTKQGILMRVPKKRVGRPEDIGAAAVFFASDEADYITGATLFVDGGWLAG
jgi:NAD(P)-dependent dehydrogenase (short-subunit alcohol dehydrogenase family)